MSTTPTDDELIKAIRAIRDNEPDLGRPMVLEKLKEQHQWSLSMKRLKAVMTTHEIGAAKQELGEMAELEQNIEQYKVPPPQSTDMVAGMMRLFNATVQFPPFPDRLLSDGYDVWKRTSRSEEYEALSPPSIPENALAVQLKYREESTRQLIIYGRGKYNFGITPNSIDGIHYTSIFNRFKDLIPFRTDEKEELVEVANLPAIRTIWEFYEVSAKQAGVSRDDVGKQFEAEWGVNMHEHVPPRLSDDPEVQRLIAKWEKRRAGVYKDCLLSILQSTKLGPVDSYGKAIWDEKTNGIFALIVTKIDKETGKECGDL